MAEPTVLQPGTARRDVGLPTVELIRPAELTPALAEELARLTRSAYAGSDPLPGLPAPDGQFEPSSALAGPVYLARDGDRRVAAVRVRPAGDCWRVSRISVLPGHRGRGLVRLLLDILARDARQRQVDWLELDAVVERCLPPLYARLGFWVRSNWPSPDKPLSELTMRRSSSAPAEPVPLGWQRARLSEHATVTVWLLDGRRLLRLDRPAGGDPLADALAAAAIVGRPGLLLAGLDLSPLPVESSDRIETFAAGRSHPEHLMPRRRQPDTLALWRPAPGREPAVDQLRRRVP
jgi:GNAT superfamily N-acetyltransferase